MGRPRFFDESERNELHEWMWTKVDSRGRLLVSQKVMEEGLHITHPTMYRLLNTMEGEGRLTMSSKNQITVVDPEVWRWKSR